MAYQLARISRRRFLLTITTFSFILLLLVILSLSTGSSMLPPIEVAKCLLGLHCGHVSKVVVDLRLTRTLTALLTGAMLAVAGVLVQAISRNPLADPYILGLSSTALAALSAAAIIDVGFLVHRHLSISVSFAGAMSGYFITTVLSLLAGGSSVSLILSGIAVTALFSGVSHVLLFMVQERLRHPYVALLMGSTTYVLKPDVVYMVLALTPSLTIVTVTGIPKALNAYLLGDQYAAQLGYRPRVVTTLSALLASLLTAVSVALVGIVGFVGLAGPHISRIVSGTADHRFTIPVSALAGSSLTILADILSRLISIASTRGEMPLGVVTSIIGAPFLAYLIVRGGRR